MTAIPANPLQNPRQRLSVATAAQIAAVCLIVAVLYKFVAADLFHDWWNVPNLTQGLLIPPLAAYIAWVKRRNILKLPVRPDNRGLWLTAMACFCYALGRIGSEFFLPRISMVLLLAGLIWTFWGAPRLRALAFPLLLLATAIPLPEIIYGKLSAPLQLFASDVAAGIAEAFGITVYRDGNIISLAHLALGVEEACSGLNSLAALMVASVLLGFLMCSRAWVRWGLFLFSIPLSVAVNVLRVAGTAILADYNEDFAFGFYHLFSGWLVFVAGFAGLYAAAWLAIRLTRSERNVMV